jgi:trehalose utilization protein
MQVSMIAGWVGTPGTNLWLAVVATCAVSLPAVVSAADPVRVVIWDEQQPAQKEAYENFLGNCIADHLKGLPGLEVRSVCLNDGEQGLSPAILDFAEVLIWWGHVRQAEIKPETVRDIVARVKAGRLTLVAVHSAHWATPFMEAMNERAREDVRRAFADVPADRLSIEEVPVAGRRPPGREARLTPTSDVKKFPDGRVQVRLHLPNCCFPAYRNDGKPSHARVLMPEHPLMKGLPESFTLPRTEMYDEPFHVPAPDLVLMEERWEPGEWFRSVMVWQVGEGRVIYIRPGHETYPIYKDANMLRIIENTVRSRGSPATPVTPQ